MRPFTAIYEDDDGCVMTNLGVSTHSTLYYGIREWFVLLCKQARISIKDLVSEHDLFLLKRNVWVHRSRAVPLTGIKCWGH
jgi:hypothetical protein